MTDSLPPQTVLLLRLWDAHPGQEVTAASAAALTGLPIEDAGYALAALVGAGQLTIVRHDPPERFQRTAASASPPGSAGSTDATYALARRRVLGWYRDCAITAGAAMARPGYYAPALQAPASDPQLGSVISPLTFSDRASARAWYEGERDTLICVVKGAAVAGLDEIAWQTAAAVMEAQLDGGNAAEWREALSIAVDCANRRGDRWGQAAILDRLGASQRLAGDLAAAEACYRQAQALFAELGDTPGTVRAANGLGLVALRRHQLGQAADAFNAALVLGLGAGLSPLTEYLLLNLGETYVELGDARAETLLRDSGARLRELGAHRSYAEALIRLARLKLRTGALDEAQDLLAQAAHAVSGGNEPIIDAEIAHYQGRHALAAAATGTATAGVFDVARASLERADSLYAQLGWAPRRAEAWCALAEAHLRQDQLDRAVSWAMRAAALFETVGDSWWRAQALQVLADAHERAGRHEDAHHHRDVALGLLTVFDDVPTQQIVIGLRQQLHVGNGEAQL